jgi:FMN phosphatase YigB (HAD superfamily)
VSALKAVLFDAGNTLVWLDHAFVVELLRGHGAEATEAEVVAAEYGPKAVLDDMVRAGRRA